MHASLLLLLLLRTPCRARALPHQGRPPALPQGTDFMLLLAAWLHGWAARKAAGDARFANTAFIISGARELPAAAL